mgnify:CR=1 FL=1
MLNERESRVLKLIIDEYIESATPVGSRFISKNSDLGLSPASIRNIMSDLEESGYISHTHVSSGRIPTDKGFRFYVDQYVSLDKITPNFFKDIEKSIPSSLPVLFKEISRKLGEISKSVGFVVSPKINNMFLRHIEFLRLNQRNVLAIIVTKSGMVHNIIFEVGEDVTDSKMQRVSNFLNQNFVGRSLGEIKDEIVTSIQGRKNDIDEIASQIETLTRKVFERGDFGGEVIVYGTKNILKFPEARNFEDIDELLNFFEEKTFVYDIVEKCIESPGVKIFIGSELAKTHGHLSLVAKPYQRGSRILGTLGVIGPKNMKYPEVVPMVDYTAEIISKLLNKIGGTDEGK